MSKYVTTPDVVGVIQSIKAQADKLERYNKATSLPTISPIPIDEWNTGVVVGSGSFADTYIFPGIFLAPTPVVRLTAVCSDDTTYGEFRIVDDVGNVLTDINGSAVAPKGIPLGTTSETSFENDQSPNYWDSHPIGTDRTLRLQVRRVGGAGTLTIRAKYLIQVPS